jgi:hypothetical protein
MTIMKSSAPENAMHHMIEAPNRRVSLVMVAAS